MKWIGQHIWEFVSRFRGKVYLEDVAEDNSVTDVLVIDPNTNELKKKTNFSGGSGGGDITVKATDGTPFNNIETIQVYDATGNGTGIQAYDNGTGNVLISVPPANFSDSFNITRATTFQDYKRIAGSVDADGKKFWAGDWNNTAGANDKWVTDDDASRFPIIYNTTDADGNVVQVGNMEGSSKIEVRIYGPTDNTSSGAGNEIGTATHTVTGATSNETFNADGIKIKILDWAEDVIPSKNKAKVRVEFSPSHIPDALQAANPHFSGSQKYYSVKIWHTNNDGTSTYGNVFEDDEFFFDGAEIQPGAPSNFQVALSNSGSTTKYLSNIKYYSGANWDVSGEDITNLARDTRSNTDIRTTITPSGVSTDSDDYKYLIVSDHDGTTDDNDNSFSTSYTLGSDTYYLSQAVGAECLVYGGMASNTSSTATSDTARAYNSYSSGIQTNTGDNFRSESHRLPHHNVNTWNVTNINQATLESYAGTDNLDSDERNLLIQTQHSDAVFKLVHPSSIGTIANSPDQDRWNGHTTPASTDFAYYYRYFELPQYGGSLTFKMTGISRGEYYDGYDDGNIEVHFSRPTNDVGNNNSWIPLDPTKNYNSNRPDNTCYYGTQPNSQSLFNIQFDTNPKVVVVRIKMKAAFVTSNTTMTGLSLTNTHS